MIVLNLVLIGLVITLEPLPLTAFILILSSKGCLLYTSDAADE